MNTINTLHIEFQRRGKWYAAKLPHRLPEFQNLCYCVPALGHSPSGSPALLLCGEQRYLEWQEDIAFLNHRIGRMAQLFQTQLEPSCTQLRIPEQLLRFADIQGPARLCQMEDGSALLTKEF